MARMIKSKLKLYFLIGLILLKDVLITSKAIAMDEQDRLLGDDPQHNYAAILPAQPLVADDNPPPHQPNPAQPLVAGDNPPPHQPNPQVGGNGAQQEHPIQRINPTPQQIFLKNTVRNTLYNDRVTIKAMSEKIQWTNFWERVNPFTKYASNAMDYIGGTLMFSISAAELNYVDDNPEYKNDITLLCSSLGIIFLKVLDKFVDTKVDQCATAEKDIFKETTDAIRKVKDRLRGHNYTDVDIENAVNAYVSTNDNQENDWVNDLVYPQTHPAIQEEHVLAVQDLLDMAQQVSLRETVHNTLHNDHEIIKVMSKKDNWRNKWHRAHIYTKGISTAIDIICGSIGGTLSFGANTINFTNEDKEANFREVSDITLLLFGLGIIGAKAVDNFVEYKVNKSELAHSDIDRKKKICEERVKEILEAYTYTDVDIRNAVDEYLNMNERNIRNWILRGDV